MLFLTTGQLETFWVVRQGQEAVLLHMAHHYSNNSSSEHDREAKKWFQTGLDNFL